MKDFANKRRIPTNKEWFYYNTNKNSSWLYCFICSSSTYHNKRLYYTKDNYNRDLPLIKKLLGVNDKRTIDSALKRLLKDNYIIEDKDKYYFPNNDEFKGRYYLIDRDLLYNLCVTKSTLTAQIFIYLSDRMKYKREEKAESTYNFTLKELRIMLGYSTNSQNVPVENAIKECLQTLKAENYIDYDIKSVLIHNKSKDTMTTNYVLTNICAEIPKKIQEVKQEEQRIEEDFFFHF